MNHRVISRRDGIRYEACSQINGLNIKNCLNGI